jgi:hypothetical protein
MNQGVEEEVRSSCVRGDRELVTQFPISETKPLRAAATRLCLGMPTYPHVLCVFSLQPAHVTAQYTTQRQH